MNFHDFSTKCECLDELEYVSHTMIRRKDADGEERDVIEFCLKPCK